MAGIKEIRTRIASVTNTQKITSAMKMVSAAKLRKAQTKAMQMRPYATKLHELLGSLCAGIDANDDVFLQKRDVKKVLIVVITSNSGLCGAFNVNVVKQAINLANTKYADLLTSGNVEFLAIGKKGGELLKARGHKPMASLFEIFNELDFAHTSVIAKSITDGFLAKEFDAVEIVYNKFINTATQAVTVEKLLPIEPISVANSSIDKYKSDFIFEPSKLEIVHEIIPRALKTRLFQSLQESFASEHGARMTAMHKATDNAGSLLRSLKIQYNKARQSSITNEIIEIVSGASALNG